MNSQWQTDCNTTAYSMIASVAVSSRVSPGNPIQPWPSPNSDAVQLVCPSSEVLRSQPPPPPRYRVLHEFNGKEDYGEEYLVLAVGQNVTRDVVEGGWAKGSILFTDAVEEGWYPNEYVKEVED